MTGIRQSFVFALENEFAKGKADGNPWIAPPVGSFFNSTHSRQATKIYTVGSKFFDTVAYGQLNGSFNWTFVFDYHYLEPLQLAFEKIGCTPNEDGVHFTHTFEKVNNMRIPSFTVRRKILNEFAGGPDESDEITELRGCVVRNVSFSKAAGTSQLQVTMTGFYVDEVMFKGDLDATDYKEYEGKLSEYMCMFVGGVSTDNYVANTESLEFSIENNSDAIYNTCSPFAGLYYEGRANCTFGTTCYSNNPSNYKQRVYSGGFRNDVLRPMAKGLKPIPLVTLAAYDKSIRDPEYMDVVDYSSALADSDESMTVELTDVVIKSLTWPKGNDQKLQDTISSAECKKITITVVNTIDDTVQDNTKVDMNYNSNNVVYSYGYGLMFYDPDGNEIKPNALITVTSGEGAGAVQVAPKLPTIGEYEKGVEKDGTTFMGWYTAPAGTSSYSAAGYEIVETNTVYNNMNLYARWIHTVNFDPVGGTLTLYEVYEGYTEFDALADYVDYYVVANGVETLVTDDNKSTLGITPGVTPAYTQSTTTDDVEMKTIVDTAQLNVVDVASFAPTKTGCEFGNWATFDDDRYKQYLFNTPITTNMTLYARWNCTVTFNMMGHGSQVSQQVIPQGDKATEPSAPTASGYTFGGWFTTNTGGVLTNEFDFDTPITANITLYAKWT